jgi:ABC-2 type transport system ATP-binding protein
MTAPSIQALGLTKKYGSFTALSNLNLKVDGAKCVGLLGPNGAGKTTTLKLFTDMIRPTNGHALINGVDVHKDKKKALSSVGTLIEMPEIYPSLTEKEALQMIAEIKGVPHEYLEKSVREVIDKVKMKPWLDQKVGKMSKGMKQRINVAAALLGDPDVVLLDEPTAGLDPRGMNEVREIIKDLKKENRLIFMSSHLLSEVSEICDEIALLDHGKLLAYGPLAEVTSRFSEKGAAVIEVSVIKPLQDKMMKRLRRLEGVRALEKLDPNRFNLRISGGAKTQQKILERMVRLKIGVTSFKPSVSALEETYLNVFKETV